MSDPFDGLIYDQISLERRIGQTEVREVPVTLAARYTTAAAQSIGNGATVIVDFGTVVFDTHARVTTGASWKFTANAAGYYAVASAITYTGTTGWIDTEAGLLMLYKNGSLYSNLLRRDSYGSASTVFMMLNGTDTVQLVAGDYIDIRAFQNSGASLALHNVAEFNYVGIWKI